MTFSETVKKHGIETAVKIFNLSDHGVFTIHENHISLRLGEFMASEPTTFVGVSVEEAKAKLSKPFEGLGITFESISA